jgi:hypothetical protein
VRRAKHLFFTLNLRPLFRLLPRQRAENRPIRAHGEALERLEGGSYAGVWERDKYVTIKHTGGYQNFDKFRLQVLIQPGPPVSNDTISPYPICNKFHPTFATKEIVFVLYFGSTIFAFESRPNTPYQKHDAPNKAHNPT